MSQKLLLVNDTSSSPNQGCQATMAALNAGLARHFGDWEVSRIPLETVVRPGVDAAWRALLPGGPGDYDAALDRLMGTADPALAAVYDSVRNADLIVVNGEGSIAENRRTRRLGEQSVFLFLLIALAHRLDRPVHLINCTLQITRGDSLALAKFPLSRCASVTVREPYSFYHGRKIYPAIQLFPDLVVTLEPPAPAIEGPYAMVGGSSSVNAVMRSTPLPQSVKTNYQNICRALTEKGVAVKLMGWSKDEFLQAFVGDGIEYIDSDYERYFSYAAGARVNFTGRHHGIVMTFAAGCPFMAMSANSFKTQGDAQLYGGIGPVEDFERLDVNRIVGNLRGILDQQRSYRDAARARREAMRPFFFGALENVLERREDLVEAGICPIGDRARDYAYDGWHRPSLLSLVTRRVNRAFGS